MESDSSNDNISGEMREHQSVVYVQNEKLIVKNNTSSIFDYVTPFETKLANKCAAADDFNLDATNLGNESHMVDTGAPSWLRVHRGHPRNLLKPRKLIFEEYASERMYAESEDTTRLKINSQDIEALDGFDSEFGYLNCDVPHNLD